MNLLQTFGNLLRDPPPGYVFEISEGGIAFARVAAPQELGFHPLDPDVISVSPVRDNVQRPEALAAAVAALFPGNGRKRQRAALILPDYCSRTAVLDFDSFPSSAAEQEALVRFRMKKSIPFDVDSAVISYYQQPRAAGTSQIDVIVSVVALEIVARYEAPFRAVGYHPGLVTTSSLAALHLVEARQVTVLAKLTGRTLAVVVLGGSVVKLVRCLELDDTSSEAIVAVLYPTFAYIEDEMGAKASRLLLCGFGALGDQVAAGWEAELGFAVEPLRSRFSTPGEANAGLLGFLESAA
jgi:type IV pilus assembly protein PilM